MQVRVGVEMLAVLVVVLLAPGLTGGLVLNKCTLQQQLNLTLNASVLDRISEVAKIVCHAELTSGLNTSAVNQIPAPPHNESQEHHPPSAGGAVGRPGDGGRPGAGGRKPSGRKPRSPKERPDKPRSETSHKEREQHSDGVWTLYGLFQLADRVACVSGSKPSLNLCGLSCDRLIDDDITDDIACVGTIINYVMANGNVTTENNKLIKKMYDLIHQSECANVQSPSGC
ncbi:hypothetical protein AOLI_G00236770 [Acnodon oligacanthus]